MGQCRDQLGPIETPALAGMGHYPDAALAGGRERVGMVHASSVLPAVTVADRAFGLARGPNHGVGEVGQRDLYLALVVGGDDRLVP